MPCLLLALAGPGQAWGTASRFEVRETGLEPSKSGVVGLLASALGRRRGEGIDDLARLRMGVRVDAAGRVERDYQTAIGAIRADGTRNDDAVVSRRYYLADAAFLVALEGEGGLLEQLAEAVPRPRWPLFLGRKAFPPGGPIACGVHPGDLSQALASGGWTDPSVTRTRELCRRLAGGEAIHLRTVLEVSPSNANDFRMDQPLSFAERSFGRRYVQLGSVSLSLTMLPRGDAR